MLLVLLLALLAGCATTPEPSASDSVRVAEQFFTPPAPPPTAPAPPDRTVEMLTERLHAIEAEMVELRARLDREAREAPPPAVAALPPPSATTSPALAADQAYAESLALFRARQYGAAERSFRAFLQRFPGHPLAVNAQYWIGESLYGRRDFPQAIVEFERVLTMPENDLKAPDALLMISQAYRALGHRRDARTALQRLIREYPGATAAQKARRLLSGPR